MNQKVDEQTEELFKLWQGLNDFYKEQILEDARLYASEQRKAEYRRAWRDERRKTQE